MRTKTVIFFLLLFVNLPNFLLAQALDTKGGLQDEYQYHIKKTSEKIKLDGVLDEASWQEAQTAGDFWRSFPVDNERVKPELQTEVKMTYDENTIYFGVKCYGPNDYIIPTLKRDNREFWTGDVFAVVIDPLNEAINAFNFGVNPAGVQIESLISGRTGTRAEQRNGSGGNSAFNSAWDNKWFSEVSTAVDHWTIEIAIPFKSLRFDPNKRSWGINFVRGEPRSNSWHTWSPVPTQFLTVDLGYTGALVWDQQPKKVKSNISVIPYTLGSVTKDFEDNTDADFSSRIGADAKIALSSSLNLDITVNPDFSQVDVDEQVTNLSTFNVRFPERRLFFLENSDLFESFGIPPMRPFFSRRIGLDEDGGTIPIDYGLRMSGNLRKDLRVGLMNMQTRATDDFQSQNYTSFTLQQRVLERSTIQAYFHNRTALSGGENDNPNDFNRIAGAEFKYFSRDAKWQAFAGYGVSMSDGFKGENFFYNVGVGYDTKSINFYTNVAGIGDNYYADMGWLPSSNHFDALQDTTFHIGYDHSFTRFNYSIWPKNQEKINAHQIGLRSIIDISQAGDVFRNTLIGSYSISFTNTARFNAEYNWQSNRLLFPFDFTDGEPLPAGKYRYDFVGVEYSSDMRRFFTYALGFEYGGFYNGTRLGTSVNVRYRVQPWGSFGVNFVYNQLDLPDPYGDNDLFLIGPRIEINFSRSVFWTTFLQYNTQRDNFNINSRLQWRFSPMSDLFIVYTDNYFIDVWARKNRGLVMKVNYWLNL